MQGEKTVAVIPCYEPSNNFITYVQELIKGGINEIVVVNDGSCSEFDGVFEKVNSFKEVTLLKHTKNQGKGYALRTAFTYLLEKNEHQNIVTADCDGQHLIKDVLSVIETVKKNPDSYVLGYRDFSKKNVPSRSRFGNVSTKIAFNFLYGIKLKDTQTGLRGFSSRLLNPLLRVSGDRFEYEMNAIIYLYDKRVNIIETPIETVYEEKPRDVNKRSHFNAITDSVKVWKALFSHVFKYFLAVIISGIIEISAFSLGVYLIFNKLQYAKNITFSSITSRILSSFINYFINFKYVFKGKSQLSIIKYYILWFILLISTTLINTYLNFFMINPVIFKLLVDLILSIFSYRIQTVWVFPNQNK